MTCFCEQIAGKDIDLSSTCLGHLWVFRDLEPAETEALNRQALRKKLGRGQLLFQQDDPADEVFLIKGGRIKLSKIFENGNEITLDIRKAGDFIGENMFSENGFYPVSAVCLEDTLACGFNRGQFEELVLENPKIGLQIIKNLSARIAWLTSRVGSLTVTNIEDRLYGVLCSIAEEHGVRESKGLVIQFPLTHEDLSFLTGSHRVSITRAMKLLKDAGKILLEGKTIAIPG